MKKKIFAALALVLCMMLVWACAFAEITVTKRDMALNRKLDKNVNNILVIMQDGEKSDSVMIASVNSRTGRSVMTMIDAAAPVSLPEAGDMELGDVYVQGAPKSRGLLVARTLNNLLDLNISTYVALDINDLPEMVDQVGLLNMWLNEEEAEILNTWAGENSLPGEDVLKYVRIRLESDYEGKNRSYTVFMDLLRQGLRESGGADLMGLGKQLLSKMDSNLNVLAAVTMLSSFRGGDDRRELYLDAGMSAEEMRAAFHREVYE